ncbi:MAG TPA: MaoC/PaaZ C-terminal domain-containing protein [Acidimicrobiales bacterium]
MGDLDVPRGPRHGPYPSVIDPARIAAYAAATSDRSPAVLTGEAVPATFPVLFAFDGVNDALKDLPREVWDRAQGGVHGEHDIVLHRPLMPGEALETWATLRAVRQTKAGLRVITHFEQIDADGMLAAEQWWTTMLLGVTEVNDSGDAPADHTFPEEARQRPLGSATLPVEDDIAQRYGEVSGDWSAHHFDLEAARASGFDFVFAHGLCTMALCTHQTVRLAAGGDPRRVRRVAVRFASPTRVASELQVDVYSVDPTSVAFEATCADATVIRHGRLELRG